MTKTGSIDVLILEEDEQHAGRIKRELEETGIDCRYTTVADSAAYREVLQSHQWDLIIADYQRPAIDGKEVLEMVNQYVPEIPAILITEPEDVETAVDAMLQGAADCIPRGNVSRLVTAVKREILKLEKRREEQYKGEKTELLKQNTYRSLFDNAMESIILFNDDGRILDVNSTAVDTIGINYDQFKEISVWDLIPDGFEHKGQQLWNRLWEKGEAHDEFVITNMLDKAVDIEFRAVTSIHPDVNMAVVRDITMRKEAEQQLKAAYEKLEYHITNTPMAFLELDKQLRIRRWSDKAEEIFGWSREEMVGKMVDEIGFIHAEDIERAHNSLNRIFSGRSKDNSVVVENRNITKDGEVLICQWYNSVLMGDNGEIESIIAFGEDITDQRKIEKKLEHLAGYPELNPNPVIEISTDGTLSYCNSAAKQSFPDLKAQGLDHPFLKGLQPQSGSYNTNMEIKDREVEVNGHFYHQTIRYLEEYDAIRIYSFNITARRNAENALLESEKKFKALTEYSLVGVYMFQDDTFTYVNPRMAEMFGYEQHEMIDELGPYDVTHPDEHKTVASKIEQRLKSEWEGVDYEVKGIKKNGELIDIEIFGAAIQFGGQATFVGSILDITDRKQAAQALQRSEQRLSTLFSNLPGMAYRSQNTRGWPMEFLSEGCKDLTGYDVRNFIADNGDPDILYGDLIVEEDRQYVWDQVQHAVDNNESFELEYRIINKQGDVRWVWERGSSIIDQDSEQLFLEGFISDITEQKQAQERIEANLHEKDILLQEIHHRVKNNLAVISGMLELQNEYEEDERINAALNDTRSRIRSMAMVHEQLYQSSSLSEISFDNYLQEMAHVICRMFSSQHRELNIDFDLEPVTLNINQALPCAQLVNEVLINAVKHAFEGKDMGQIALELSEKANLITLSIRDDGVGLPDDFNMENPQSLGTLLITALRDQLEASMEIESEREKGTRFTLQFRK